MLFVFPVLCVVVWVETQKIYVLCMYDISRDAYKGKVGNRLDRYLSDRISG